MVLDYALFTPTEQRLLAILADGLPHSSARLFDAISDELAELTAVKAHIWSIRQKFAKQAGFTIITQRIDGEYTYRLAGVLVPDR